MPSFQSPLLFFIFVSANLGSIDVVQAQTSPNFEGFYADIGAGYRNVNSSSSSSLTLNGVPIPNTFSSGTPDNVTSSLTVGYDLSLATNNFVLGIGANITPASGQAQQVQVQALNQTIALGGTKPLYNYGFFIKPGLQIGEGLGYLKIGTQTQVNNSNTSPNFYGYLLGLGYKQPIFESIYVFGEADYQRYGSQMMNKTVISSGRTINATITTTPQGSRFLLGIGYMF